MPGLDDVDMGVEVNRRSGPPTLTARHDVGAGIAVAVTGSPFAAHEDRLEPRAAQPAGDILGARRVGLSRRIDGGKADKVGGEGDKVVAAVVDGAPESFVHGTD